MNCIVIRRGLSLTGTENSVKFGRVFEIHVQTDIQMCSLQHITPLLGQSDKQGKILRATD